MSSSSFETINTALTTGTIIAIVVGSIFGLVLLIGTIVTIACIVRYLNRSKRESAHHASAQPVAPQPYSYPQAWSNAYSTGTVNTPHYPTMYQTVSAPYTMPPMSETKPVEP